MRGGQKCCMNWKSHSIKFPTKVTSPTGSWIVSSGICSSTLPATRTAQSSVSINYILLIARVDGGLRAGADKITFVETKYRNVIGQYLGITNIYLDTFYNATNGLLSRQYVAYFTTNTPDILITAQDLNGPTIARTDTSGWINNDAINGSATRAGPGVIAPGLVITLSTTGPYFVNDDSDPLFLFEAGASSAAVWGAFDGTTNRPVIFPNWESIDAYEQRILRE